MARSHDSTIWGSRATLYPEVAPWRTEAGKTGKKKGAFPTWQPLLEKAPYAFAELKGAQVCCLPQLSQDLTQALE